MKPIALIFASLLTVTACNQLNKSTSSTTDESVADSSMLRFCESVLPLTPDSILIGNFGSSELNPLNKEGKGFISLWHNFKIETFIAADGNLSAPKGMCLRNGYLYIADVNKIVVYEMANLKAAPQIVPFPPDAQFVNDLAVQRNWLFVSVTDEGMIYRLDISNPKKLASATLKPYKRIYGANGIVIDGNRMYIASYPPSGQPSYANGIYLINDMAKPEPKLIVEIPGAYDGLALNKDRNLLFFSTWNEMPDYNNCKIGFIDLENDYAITAVNFDEPFEGPADIAFAGDNLLVPDLVRSRVILLKSAQLMR